MIGFFDYTVWLTYASLLSAGAGILVSLDGDGHPYWGTFFLLFCGLCDAFDGKVARTKKDRTETHQKFGIQIDSLSDLVAFGVLPVCIGMAMVRRSNLMDIKPLIGYCLAGVMLIYLLAAMIRLAYFNVAEEERQKKEKGVRRTYEGLPVTSAALIFPTVMLFQFISKRIDITPVYFGVALLTGVLFLSRIRIGKPGLRGILWMVGIGAVEFFLMLFWKVILK
jgi:CDP-diacylglycerol--serine O-phosphatidyltransferase